MDDVRSPSRDDTALCADVRKDVAAKSHCASSSREILSLELGDARHQKYLDTHFGKSLR
jgi:hypothetical protein